MKVWMCFVAMRFDSVQLPMCRLQPAFHIACGWHEMDNGHMRQATSTNAPESTESNEQPDAGPDLPCVIYDAADGCVVCGGPPCGAEMYQSAP